MNKRQKLEKWLEDNHEKYPDREAWRKALLDFVEKDLNYTESTWTATCWCGKSHPCDGADHDLLLSCKIALITRRLEKELKWIYLMFIGCSFVFLLNVVSLLTHILSN